MLVTWCVAQHAHVAVASNLPFGQLPYTGTRACVRAPPRPTTRYKSADTLRVISSSTLFSAMYAMLMYGEEYAFMTSMKALYLGTARKVPTGK